MAKIKKFSHQRVGTIMNKKYFAICMDMTVQQAIDQIRENVTQEQIIYFYVTDHANHLKGVVSARKLLTSALTQTMGQVMDTHVKAIPEDAEVVDIMTDFMVHKYLALPVLNHHKQLVGIVDVDVFTANISDMMEREQVDNVFETIGFHLSQIRDSSPFHVLRYRFPWLLANIIGGILCALMASKFANILAVWLPLAFFLTLVLGLGESVSMQSMTITIQALHSVKINLKWYLTSFSKELFTAMLLGIASGIVVGGAVFLWHRDIVTAIVVGGSLIATLTFACLVGLSIPAALHALRLDPKVSAGPLTLAISDIVTIFVYFSIAAYAIS
jgi:magnesium transporter